MLCPIAVGRQVASENERAVVSPPRRQHLQVAAKLRSQWRRGVVVESACECKVVVGVEQI